jgi:hypothetical protein
MSIQAFTDQLAPVASLAPREVSKKKVAQPSWTKQAVTIVGVKTVTNRFLPVSHEGYSNETYVDKVDLLGRTRAEFIGRKMKGIERRMHMALFRELAEQQSGLDWLAFWKAKFGADSGATIPDKLCLADWNTALFGGLDAGNMAVFSRIRYFDTFSVQDTADCVGSAENEEMGIGNQVYEDLSQARGSETYHLYEYVKAGTKFPFITMIEAPTLLDVAAMIQAIRRADNHGYGKYSANHGKFNTEFLMVATGYPRFSVLDMLEAAEQSNGTQFLPTNPQFDALQGSIALTQAEIDVVADLLVPEFAKYAEALG